MLQAKLPPFLSLKDALMLRASCKSFSRTTVFQLLFKYCSKVDVRHARESHRSAEQLVLSLWQPMIPPDKRKSKKRAMSTFSCCCGTCCPCERDQYRGSGCLDLKPRHVYLEPLFGVICRPVICMAGEPSASNNMFMVAIATLFLARVPSSIQVYYIASTSRIAAPGHLSPTIKTKDQDGSATCCVCTIFRPGEVKSTICRSRQL